VTGIDKRMDDGEDHHLGTRADTDAGRVDLHLVAGGQMLRYGLPKFRDTRRRRIMRCSLFKPLDTGVHDWSRGIEIGFADFEMDNASSLTLQFVCPSQGLERSFSVHTLHAFGDPGFTCRTHGSFLTLR